MLRSRLNFGFGPLTITLGEDRGDHHERTTTKIPVVEPTLGQQIRTYDKIDTRRGVRRIIVEIPYPDYKGLTPKENKRLQKSLTQVRNVFIDANRRVMNETTNPWKV